MALAPMVVREDYMAVLHITDGAFCSESLQIGRCYCLHREPEKRL